MKWPLVRRWRLDLANRALAESIKLADQRENARKIMQTTLEKERQEFRTKWQPLMLNIASVSARRIEPGYSSSFAITVTLNREVMEHVASVNDQRHWDYIAEELAYSFRRQIATLNFAGLHRLAEETEQRMRYGTLQGFQPPFPRQGD